jgi:GTPase SAR1 family protein
MEREDLESSTQVERQLAQKRIFKIIVIGDSNVGKTCLTFRFCGGRFPDRTEATIGVDFRERQVDLDGEMIKVKSHLHSESAEETRSRLSLREMKCHLSWSLVSSEDLDPSWLSENRITSY